MPNTVQDLASGTQNWKFLWKMYPLGYEGLQGKIKRQVTTNVTEMTYHSPMNHFVIILTNVIYELPGTILKVLCILSYLITTTTFWCWCYYPNLQGGSWHPERLSNSPKVTELISERTYTIWIRFGVWFWRKSHIIRGNRGNAEERTEKVYNDRQGRKKNCWARVREWMGSKP